MSVYPQGLLDAVDVGILEIDLRGCCTFVNKLGALLLGAAPTDIVGQSLSVLLSHGRQHGRLHSVEQSPIMRTIRIGQQYHAESDLLWRRDGSCFHASVTAQPVYRGDTISGAILTFFDISSHMHVLDQATWQHEQRFLDTFKQAGVGISHLDINGRWLYVNQRLCEIVGYSEAELRALTFQDITHPDDLDADLKYFEQILRGDIPTYSMEKRYFRKDGSIVWIHLTVSLVRDADGNPDYFISVIEDINESRQARESIEQAAKRAARLQQLATALGSALVPTQVAEAILGEGVYALGALSGVIVQRTADDPTMLEIVASVGYPPRMLQRWRTISLSTHMPVTEAVRTNRMVVVNSQEELKQRYPTFIVTETRQGLGPRAAVPLQIEGKAIGAMVFSFGEDRFLDGDDQAMLASLARLCGQAFERARLYAAEQHARAAAQEAAQREQERATQLRGLADASLVINSTLSLNDMLQLVTEQARQLIGAHQGVASFMIDKNWAQSINTVSFSDKYAAWRTYSTQPNGTGIYSLVCRTNQPMRLTQAELEAHPAWHNFGKYHKEHPPLNGWLAAPLIGSNEQNLGLIQLSDKYEGEFTAEDEAILVQLAHFASVAVENARLYQAAQEAVRLRDEFLSIASHELKTPITTIKLQIQTMLRMMRRADKGSIDSERLIGKIASTEQQIERLTGLVDELLDISRIARGRLELRYEEHDLAKIVREVVARFEEQLTRINCPLTLHADEPVIGWWDGFRLEQVVTNLVSNAIKYGACRPIDVWVRAANDRAQLVVRDQGIGIGQDDIDRIFAPFERAVSSKHYSGLGLGLFIVRQIIEVQGGTISVTSTPGAGSTFTVDLPLRQPEAANKPDTMVQAMEEPQS